MEQVQEQVHVHGKNYVSLNRKKASCYVAYFLESSGYSWESLRRGVRLAAELLKIPHDGLRRSAIAVMCMDKLIQMNIHPPMGYPVPWSKIQPSIVKREKSAKLKFYESWEWKQLRYETLKKYGRKCLCCGASSKEAVIVVDHIIPVTKRWDLRLDPDNLQVLCDDCNRGKTNRDATDWRVNV